MLGVMVSVVASQIIGTIWYSTYFLGKPWMSNNYPGKSSEQISREGNFPVAIGVCVVGQTCLALVLHYILLSYLGISGVEAAIRIGVGLGALVTVSDIPHCLFSCRSVIVFIIDHLYDTAVFVAMCASIVHFG